MIQQNTYTKESHYNTYTKQSHYNNTYTKQSHVTTKHTHKTHEPTENNHITTKHIHKTITFQQNTYTKQSCVKTKPREKTQQTCNGWRSVLKKCVEEVCWRSVVKHCEYLPVDTSKTKSICKIMFMLITIFPSTDRRVRRKTALENYTELCKRLFYELMDTWEFIYRFGVTESAFHHSLLV